MIKHKQINNMKMKKSSCNAVYISFFVYNINVNIHYINVSFHCNNTDITLKNQQIYNCDF